jgi:hypothetical protein
MDIIRGLLQHAIELAGGSQASLGKACGRSQNAIYHAVKTGRVSPDLAIRISNAVKGAIPAHKLCPLLGDHDSQR